MTNIEILKFNNKVHTSLCKTTTEVVIDDAKGILVVITEWTECHCNGDEKND